MSPFSRWWPRILLLLLVLHYSRGILPCVPVEGDEQGVINGVLALQRNREDVAQIAYLYAIQPGTYQLLRLVCSVGEVSPIIAFGVLSAVGAGAFVFASSFLLGRLVPCRPVFIALGFMGAQEMCAAAFYANSSALAAPFLMAALLLALKEPSWRNSLFMGCAIATAGWIRLDVLLISPVILPLLIHRSESLILGVKRTAVVAGIAGVLLLVLLGLSGVSPTDSWGTYSSRDGGTSFASLGRLWWVTTSPAWSLIILAGVLGLIINRKCWLLSVIFLAAAPTFIVYGRSFTTTKYLYYAVPFTLIPGFWLINELSRSSRKRLYIGAYLIAAGIAVESLLGVRTSSETLRRFDPGDWSLYCGLRVRLFPRPVQIGWGEGEILPTADGFRLRGACFHMPYVWSREKRRSAQFMPGVQKSLLAGGDQTIITSTYLSAQVLSGILILNNGACTAREATAVRSGSTVEEWVVANHVFHVINVNHTDQDRNEFDLYSSAPGSMLFLNDRGSSAALHLGVLPPTWTCELACENALLTLYRRKAR